jgi:hypothetical protein
VVPATFADAGAVEVMLKLWVALLKVKVTVVVAALKLLSAALVTVKVQVPEEVALSVEPLNEQPVAVPSATDEMLSAPVPEPPVTEVTVNDVCEYGYVLLVALSTGDEIADWAAFEIWKSAEELTEAKLESVAKVAVTV